MDVTTPLDEQFFSCQTVYCTYRFLLILTRADGTVNFVSEQIRKTLLLLVNLFADRHLGGLRLEVMAEDKQDFLTVRVSDKDFFTTTST